MRERLLALPLALAMTFAIAGCGDSDNPSSSKSETYETLTTYMADNEMDLPVVLGSWIIAASSVVDNEANYYIIDLRSATDYSAGHVEGAVNSTLSNVLTTAAGSGGKPILVICYTGQTAGHAVVALRLSGYPDAKVLMFGMSSWSSDFDKWTPNTASLAVGNPHWTDAAVAAAKTYGVPEISASSSNGAEILQERVAAMLAGGFRGVNASDVLDNPGNYFINNYWSQADVDHYGHIDGAHRIMENLSVTAGGLESLDPDETIVTYCWTGQTSSMITAYLTVLGYDAVSLKFGSNAMIYEDLEGHKWTASFDYPYVGQ